MSCMKESFVLLTKTEESRDLFSFCGVYSAQVGSFNSIINFKASCITSNNET